MDSEGPNITDVTIAFSKAVFGAAGAIFTPLGPAAPFAAELIGLGIPGQRVDVLEQRIARLETLFTAIVNSMPDQLRPKIDHNACDFVIKRVANIPDNEATQAIQELLNDGDSTFNALGTEDRFFTLTQIHLNEKGKAVQGTQRVTSALQIALLNKALSIPTLQERGGHYFDLGVLFGAAGKHVESIEAYLAAISNNDPNPSLCFMNIGNRFQAMNMNEQALTSWERAIELNPRQCLAYLYAGERYRQIGKYKEAYVRLKFYVDFIDENNISEDSKYYFAERYKAAKEFIAEKISLSGSHA
ncbi:MAG: hypothetical protein BGO63_19135 [Candidatus Accumulibacter sp. 66-26]|nr:tetratricopeptide repeat protein [Accumulibacter sp.]OJW51999.1 MAG: hypothetical protein BGO63_19135 [Candidatus Accumulibacter sp. 66-26]